MQAGLPLQLPEGLPTQPLAEHQSLPLAELQLQLRAGDQSQLLAELKLQPVAGHQSQPLG